MSLSTLVTTFKSQAAANNGNITIDAATFTSSGLTPPSGLDDLLQKAYHLDSGTSLLIDTSNTSIPDPSGNILTISGAQAAVLNVKDTDTSVGLIITDDGTGNIQFTIQVELLSNWTFATSWQYMTGGVFDNIPYTSPYFVFSTNDNNAFNWNAQTIGLISGQNLAAEITLTMWLSQVTQFLTSWSPSTKLALVGSIDPSAVDNETILYPEMNLFVLLNATPISMAFLEVNDPGVGFQIVTIDETDPATLPAAGGAGAAAPATTDKTQTPVLYFQMQLGVGSNITMDFSTSIDSENSTFTIDVSSDPSAPLTPLNLFSLMAGNNWFDNIPPVLQQFLNAIAFKEFGTTVSFNSGLKISSVSAVVGSNGAWTLFDNFIIQEFDVTWLILNPGTSASSQSIYFTAQADFFPTLFKGGFYVEITSDLALSASFDGSVTFNDIIADITNNAIVIPANLVSVEFTRFGVDMDIPGKYYSFYANANVNIDFITNISIEDGSLRLTSTSPASGSGPSVYTAAISGLFTLGPLSLQTDVNYSSDATTGGWDLSIVMPPGDSINIGEVVQGLFTVVGFTLPSSFLPDDLNVVELGLTAKIPNGATKGTYGVSAGFDWQFTFPIINQNIDIKAQMKLTYDASKASGKEFSGSVSGSVLLEYFNAQVDLSYKFSPTDQNLSISWEGFTATYDVSGKSSTIIFEIKNWSVGEIITSFMKMLFNPSFELEAPWNVLNAISLDGFKVTYDLNNKDVTVDYTLPKSIDLVFINISGIKLTKNASGVQVSFDGSSVVPSINSSSLFDKSKGQDITDMPEVPGQGNKYFDLRLLAMGQHIALQNVSQYTNIQEVTAAMEKAFTEPKEGEIPISGSSLLSFDENSNWLIATDFGILKTDGGTAKNPEYTLDMQVVFNDPNLYGLRIAMAGPKAKVLAGLDFEILYKKISDSVGVYQMDLTLPAALRYLQFGEVNITLPSISLEIYTNGDFMVDIGFPYNLDFSRSFTVQAIVPPGIPAMGSGGFYFGKLSSATTKKVPQTTNGDFNPVIVFGIGMQVGVGYSVHYGVLNAGFSLTIFGILEGIIATYHPYQGQLSESNSTEVQTSYYYWLQGTMGIIGQLYGSIDFGIISANVNITLKIYAQATLEAYNKMPLSVVASVDVKVSAKVDLGIFSFTVHFSFSATIRQDLTIGTDRTSEAPWNNNLGTGAAAMLMAKPYAPRLTALRSNMHYKSLLVTDVAETAPSLNLYFAPHLTIAGPEDGKLGDQAAQYVATLWIDSPDPSNPSAPTTSFEYLSKDFFSWLITNYLNETATTQTRAEASTSAVSQENLDHLLSFLSNEETPLPIDPDDLLSFLQNTFDSVNIQELSSSSKPDAAAVFPMFFDLELKAPDASVDIDFSSYNMADDAYLSSVKEWFAQLAVQVADENNNDQASLKTAAAVNHSISTFVFEDYFVLIGKQLIGYANDALQNFTYPLSNGNGLAAIVNWANNISTSDGTTNNVLVTDLAKANQSHPLNQSLDITISGVMHSIQDQQFFNTIASKYALMAETVIDQNANAPGVVAPQDLTLGANSYTVKATDTINDIATGLKTDLATLSTDTDFQTKATLTENVLLTIAAAQYIANDGDDFTSVATAYSSTLDASTILLENQVAPNLFIEGSKITYQSKDYTVLPGDNLQKLATAFSSLLSSTVSVSDLAGDAAIQATPIQPLAIVLIPPFTFTTATFTSTTVSDADTLGKIAQKYATTAEVLAQNYDNQQLNDLFYAGDGYTTVNVPGLSCLDVDSILSYFSANNSYTQLAGMASRYPLHGMRLPITDSNGTPIPGLTLSSGSPCSGQNDCALYRLTGQQFALPSTVAAGFEISLVNKNLDWLALGGTKPTTSDAATLSISLTADDVTQINTVLSYAQKTGLEPEIQSLAPMTPFELLPAQYAFQTVTKWSCSGDTVFPYGSAGSQTDVSPLIWNFPGSLLQKIAVPKKAGSAFDIQIGTYNATSGKMDYKSSDQYGWSTLLEIDIKQQAIDDSKGSAPFTYELLGANEAGTQILKRLLDVLDPNSSDNNAGVIADIQWLYKGGDGLMSIGNLNMKTFIVQSNLSTETNPVTMMAKAAALAVATPAPNGVLNSLYDFVKLLWECSITRSGGYYLLYNDILNKVGLPSAIFDSSGNASISLLVTYSDSYQDKLSGFMNCAITGDKIDTTASVVYAESEEQTGLTYTTAGTEETLSSIAAQYNILLSTLAELNATKVTLADGTGPITLENLQHEVGLPSDTPTNTLTAIAAYYNVDEQAIKDLNPDVTAWTNLPVWQLLKLPKVSYTVSSAAGTAGNTIESIANYFFIDVASLAFAMKDANVFADSTSFDVVDQIVQKVSSVTQGNAGFELKRTDLGTPPATTDPGYAEKYINNLYNLLSYQVVGNTSFNESIIGLPASPTSPSDNEWLYNQIVPIAQYAKLPNQYYAASGNLPSADDNPYRGIGSQVQVHFDWVDYYGNKTVTPFSDPELNINSPLNNIPIQVGYMDELKGLGQWPSLFVSYEYGLDDNEAAQLSLNFSFNTERYEDSTDNPDFKKNAEHDLALYATIYYQINQLNPLTQDNTVSFDLNTSLTPGTSEALTTAEIAQLNDYVASIYNYLYAIVNDQTPTAPVAMSIKKVVDLSQLESASIFELTVSLDMSRDLSFVNNDFKDSPSVTYAKSSILPNTQVGVGAEADTSQEHKLTQFALNFEKAFYTDKKYVLKITTGVNQVNAGGQKKQAIFVARLALTPGNGIYWNVAQAGTYQISAASISSLNNAGVPTAITAKLSPIQDTMYPSKTQFDTALQGVLTTAEFTEYQLQIYTYSQLNASFYAPKPTSTSLSSKKAVSICPYTTGAGIDCASAVSQNFSGIDMDIWGKQSLEAIDLFLSSEFAVPAFLVDQLKASDEQAFLSAQNIDADSFLEAITNAKSSLADTLSERVEPVLTSPAVSSSQLTNAREKFKQQLLNKLGNNYTISAVVQMDVTAQANMDSEGANKVAPRLYGAPTILGETEEDSKLYSISNAKIQLQYNGDPDTADLSFIFSTKDAKEFSAVPLNMDYQVTHIEFDITNDPALDGYQASQWLTLVIPVNIAETQEQDFDLSPIKQPLGELDIPVVLRNYPTPPSLTQQTGIGADSKGDTAAEILEKASEWDFNYTYSEDQAAQDQIYSEIAFNTANSASPIAMFKAGTRDLFSDMAQFISVWPAIAKDLNSYLTQIGPDTDSTDPNLDNAYEAMAAMVQISNNLSIAWSQYIGTGSFTTSNTTADSAYDFIVRQQADADHTTTCADGKTCPRLLLTVVPPNELSALDKSLFNSVGSSQTADLPSIPVVHIDNYLREEANDANGNPIPNAYWYYQMVESDKVYLGYEDSFDIPNRTIENDGLNVLQFQNAWPSIALIRNENLVEGNPTQQDFIYRTPLIRFSNKYVPLLKNDTLIDISKLQDNNGKKLALADHLAIFFSTFFKDDQLAEQTVKLSASWNYQLQTSNTSLPEIELPILLYTPFTFEIPSDYTAPSGGCPDPVDSSSPFICQLAAALKAWYNENEPVTTAAYIDIDVSVFSALSEKQLPLIELTNVQLPFNMIQDL
jgi:LysM repeat protein